MEITISLSTGFQEKEMATSSKGNAIYTIMFVTFAAMSLFVLVSEFEYQIPHVTPFLKSHNLAHPVISPLLKEYGVDAKIDTGCQVLKNFIKRITPEKYHVHLEKAAPVKEAAAPVEEAAPAEEEPVSQDQPPAAEEQAPLEDTMVEEDQNLDNVNIHGTDNEDYGDFNDDGIVEGMGEE